MSRERVLDLVEKVDRELPLEVANYLAAQVSFIEDLTEGRIPEKFPETTELFGDPMSRISLTTPVSIADTYFKRYLNNLGMYGVVDLSWTANLAEWLGDRSALEVMAGRGYLTKALRHHGTNVRATDNGSWNIRPLDPPEVEPMDGLAAVNTYEAQVLIVSWPPYEGRDIISICDAWGTDKLIVFIGEPKFGCTACDEFYDRFDVLPVDIPMPSHYGIHDRVMVGRWTQP